MPPPKPIALAGDDHPFKMLVTTLEADPYLGRILTGRIESGAINVNRVIKALNRDGKEVERARATKLLAFRGLARVPVVHAEAGDIVAIAGLQIATVADTLCDPQVEEPIAATPIDPPTLAITLAVNDSPLAGREGDKVQTRVIRDRLLREAEGNVAIKLQRDRRRRFRSRRPRRTPARRAGRKHAPRRLRAVDQPPARAVPEGRERPANGWSRSRKSPSMSTIPIPASSSKRSACARANCRTCGPSAPARRGSSFFAPSRGLIGYHGEFLTDTRGTGVMNRMFHGFAPHKGPIEGRRNGVLISTGDGEAVAYALWYLEERGRLFITPGTKVYQGMIIGENAKDNDLDVNPLKAKQLTNIRTTSKDEAVKLTPITPLTLEQAIAYIEDDELVEVTPQTIRLRKQELVPHLRKRAKADA